MTTWNEFVKQVQLDKQVSRKEAMRIASPLWQKKKLQDAKNPRRKKAKIKGADVPEISEFPKVKKQKKKRTGKRVAVPATIAVAASQLGGRLPDSLHGPSAKRGRKRLTKKHVVLQDSHFRFLAERAGM